MKKQARQYKRSYVIKEHKTKAYQIKGQAKKAG